MIFWVIIIVFICAIACFCGAWSIRAWVGFRARKGIAPTPQLLKTIDILRYTALGLTVIGLLIFAISKSLAS